MSDSKKPEEFSFDDDWESALEDWETTAFSDGAFSNLPPRPDMEATVSEGGTDALDAPTRELDSRMLLPSLEESALSRTTVQLPAAEAHRPPTAPAEDELLDTVSIHAGLPVRGRQDSVTRVLLATNPPMQSVSVGPPPLVGGAVEPLEPTVHDCIRENERAPHQWLSEAERQDFWDTGRWLMEEANVATAPVLSARLFAAASEIICIAGDKGAAQELALEAVRAAPEDEACALLVRQHALLSDVGDDELRREMELASTEVRKRTLGWLHAAQLRYRGIATTVSNDGTARSAPLDLEGFIASWREDMDVTDGVPSNSPFVKGATALRALLFDNWNEDNAPSLPYRELCDAFSGERIPEAVHALEKLGAAEPALAEACEWMAASLSLHHDGMRTTVAEHFAKLDSVLANQALATFGVESKSAPLIELAGGALTAQDAQWVTALFPSANMPVRGNTLSSPETAALAGLAGEDAESQGALRRFARAAVRQKTETVQSLSGVLGDNRVLSYEEIREERRPGILKTLDALIGEHDAYPVAAALACERLGELDQARKYYVRARGAQAWQSLRSANPVEGVDAEDALVSLLEALRAHDPNSAQRGAERLATLAPTWGLAERLGSIACTGEDRAHWRRLTLEGATEGLEASIERTKAALFDAPSEDVALELLREARRNTPHDMSVLDAIELRAGYAEEERSGEMSSCLRIEGAVRTWLAGKPAPALLQIQDLEFEEASPLATLRSDLAVEAGDERAADALLMEVRATEDLQRRVEGYERLADLDANRGDHASMLLWHQTILEESPDHLPSMRTLEHALIQEGRVEELVNVFVAIARVLADRDPAEVTAHACVATRIRAGADDAYWPQTKPYAELAANENPVSMWATRALNAHARVAKSDSQLRQTYEVLLSLTQTPQDRSAILLRLADVLIRQGRKDEATRAFEEATTLDPADLVAWEALAESYETGGRFADAANGCEMVANACTVTEHQVSALYEAAQLWRKVGSTDRETLALEKTAKIDASYSDTFARLSQLYTIAGRKGDLAQLLESRLAKAETLRDRTSLQVELGRALYEMGDFTGAARALQAALHTEPSHLEALQLYATTMYARHEYGAAEAAWVQLARFATTPSEQRTVYLQLGDLYATHLNNPGRAEIAYQELLKRTPNDEVVLRKLIALYRSAGDVQRTLDTYEVYLKLASDPKERERRLVELSLLTEGQNPRKAEAILEASRKEFPTSVVSLRALAEFFGRQRQMPALNVLLDRAAADARRAISAGRFTASLFQTLSVVFELRGRVGGAAVVDAALAAFEGRTMPLEGLGARAVDPRLDEFTAPELISPPLRTLLSRNGDALDAASPLDLKRLSAGAVPPQFGRVVQVMGQLAQQMGMGGLSVLVSPRLGRVCLPASSASPMLVVGKEFLEATEEGPRLFLTLRALKLIYMRASLLVRLPPGELAIMLGAWFKAFNPTWVAPGLNAAQLAEATKRIVPVMPKKIDPQLAMMALEAAATLGSLSGGIGSSVVYWSNRTALLGTGDVTSALTALAWSLGQEGVPSGAEARAAWIARTPDARDILTYAISDPYLEARRRSGLSA